MSDFVQGFLFCWILTGVVCWICDLKSYKLEKKAFNYKIETRLIKLAMSTLSLITFCIAGAFGVYLVWKYKMVPVKKLQKESSESESEISTFEATIRYKDSKTNKYIDRQTHIKIYSL
jgi:hypothetical protein